MIRSSFLSHLAILAISAPILTGCVTRARYVHDPQLANSAKVVMTTDTPRISVSYWVSTSGTLCKGFQGVGYVFDHDKKNQGSIAKFMDKVNFLLADEHLELVAQVPGGQNIQIQAYEYTDVGGFITKCGPVTTQFSTDPNGQYKVNFDAHNGMCTLSVFDISKLDAPVRIKHEMVNFCSL